MRAFFRSLGWLIAAASLTSFAQGKIDYIIVGGGTAGLVVANRLTENPSVQVLVLEAGGDGLGNTNISNFAGLGAAFGTAIDWSFPVEPLPFANNIAIKNEPRGKVLGGSSAINGDVWDRGDAREYDMWESLGNPGWNFNTLFAASKKSERFFTPNATDNIEFALKDHGLTGNVATAYSNPAPAIHNDIISAVVNAGGIKSTDLAGGLVNGISHATNAELPSNQTRSTSATAYYFPFSFRRNLQVSLFSTVSQIIWKSTSNGSAVASGIQYIDQNGVTHTVTASNVILSAGSLGSPAILERSGVGNKTYLASLGITSVIDLPGVGENLQEQTIDQLQWAFNATLPTIPSITPFLINFESLQKTVGPDSLTTVQSMLNIKPPGLSDAQWNVNKDLFNLTAPWIEHFIQVIPASENTTLDWYIVNLHAQSRGSVHIVSSDPLKFPKLQYNLLESPLDTFVMASAAKRAQEIVATAPLSNWISGPLKPAAGVNSIPDLQNFVLSTAGRVHHPVGTALMSPREIGGVVDQNLKVYGTRNVYVIDASIIPIEPSAHTQATVYALAERAAQLFKH